MRTKTYCYIAFLLMALPGMAQQSYSFDLNGADPCAPAGIQETMGKIGIYPNPVSGILVVEVLSPLASLTCMDTQGKTVKEVQLQNGKQEISLRELPAGMYFIRIQNGDKFYNTKITVE